ncbi:OmpA family protein [Comamonas testosteroni]|uniref:OmpA family protein n=1 Tax=Comamonas testosteroni TaxID=285 RepID=A0A096FNT6_COMTE|nr:OmpA family protein [Comamonas testosteroni]KGH31559.1 ompA family protein [Comamonas testosteroni]
MLRHAVARRAKEEGEKPFWISYADLMSAMMVLFLVVMVVSIVMLVIAVKPKPADGPTPAQLRYLAIQDMCKDLQQKANALNQTIKVECSDHRIEFGEAGRFPHNSYSLNPEGRKALQEVVPLILQAADSQNGKDWFKQVVIEGFTDTEGSYLYNLHLSLQRSEWVMCSLLDARSPLQHGLSEAHQQQIRKLFLAGGVSFNNQKKDAAASRRVELSMQFYGLDEKEKNARSISAHFDTSVLEKCQLEMR